MRPAAPESRPLDTAPPATRRGPNLLVIGAMKASTTSFYELITRHPRVWFPGVKEPHYFTSPDFGRPEAWRAYNALFDDAPDDALVIGEASTGYTKLPRLGPTPERIRETLGPVKLIYLLRDPVARAVSNFQHSHAAAGRGASGLSRPMRDVVRDDPIILQASRYAYQIKAYLEVFDEDDLLVLTTEEVHNATAATMRRVETLLGLPAFDGWPESPASSNARRAVAQTATINRWAPRRLLSVGRRLLPGAWRARLRGLAPAGPTPPEPTAEDIAYLQAELSDDLRELVAMLGERIACWPSVQRLSEAPREAVAASLPEKGAER